MYALLKKIVTVAIIFIGCVWLGAKLPPVQRFLKKTIEHSCRSFGIDITIEQIDIIFPFSIRLQGVSAFDSAKKAEPLFSCERLAFTPLLLDIPLNRVTILRLKGRGLSIDVDAIDDFVKKLPASESSAISLSLSHIHLSSVHLKSHLLPLEEHSFDCSLRGKISLSENRDRGSLALSISKCTPSFWPKRVDLALSKHLSEYSLGASIFLSTEGLDAPKQLLFSSNDRLEVACVALLKDIHSDFTLEALEKLTGSWKLECPSSPIPLFKKFLVNHACAANGSISYSQKNGFFISCDTGELALTLNKLVPKQLDFDRAPESQILSAEPINTVTIKAQGNATFSPNDNTPYTLLLQIPQFSINDLPGSLTGQIDFNPTPGVFHAKTTIDGSFLQGSEHVPIHFSGEAENKPDVLAISADLIASLFRASTRFDIKGPESTLWTSVRCQDLSLLQSFLNTTISGSAELSSRYVKNLQKSTVSISGNCTDLLWETSRCKNGDFHLSTEIPSWQNVSMTADVMGVRHGPLSLDRAHTVLSCDIVTQALRLLEAQATGRFNKLSFDLFGSGEGQSDGKTGFLLIDRIEGKIGEEPLFIEQPLRLEHTGTAISAVSTSLRLGQEGRITGRWNSSSQKMATGDISLDHVPLHDLTLASGMIEAYGTFDGQGHLQATPQSTTISGQLQAQISQLGIIGNDAGRLALGGSFSVEDDLAKGEICIAGMGIEEPLIVNISAPITSISKFPFIQLEPSSPLHGEIKGDIHLSQLLAGCLPGKAGFEAIIGADVNINGTVESPLFHGPIQLRKGRIDLLSTGEVICDIEMDGSIDNRLATIHKITATDDKNGHITGHGTLELTDDNLLWQAILDCTDIEAISLDYATATADGTIKLEGNLSGLTISGSAISKKAVIDLAARFPSDIPEIDVTYRNEKIRPDVPFRILFDLSIDGSAGVDIKGRGLSSFCDGRFHLGGEVEQLRVEGYLRCVRGTFTLSSKELTISEGTVSLNGDLFKDSRLNVIANITLPSITAQAYLKGSLESPKLSIQSTPPRPDTEILSLLLFNKEYGDISPLQSLQLANTAMGLQRSSGPFGLVDQIKETLGIDIIDMGSMTPGAPSAVTPISSTLDPSDMGPAPIQPQNDMNLKVGKYISDGVAITVSRNVTTEANYLGFEAQLAPEITANAEVGDDQAGIVSIKWKKNY